MRIDHEWTSIVLPLEDWHSYTQKEQRQIVDDYNRQTQTLRYPQEFDPDWEDNHPIATWDFFTYHDYFGNNGYKDEI